MTAKKKELSEAAEVVVAEPIITETAVETAPKTEKAPAKAGKRSPKALAESEVKLEKKLKKTANPESDAKKQVKAAIKTRSKLERSGKKYREVSKLLEKDKTYSLAEALELATKTTITKFDATVELHVNLGVDPKQADQNIRDTLSLPAGTGKNIRIAAFVEADDIAKAKAAGADIAGVDQITALLDKEEINFDILVATPLLMAKLGKYARLLGPKGLMPSPKSGTVTADFTTAIKESKAGKVEYRVDQAGIVHLGIGKVSFGADKLQQNADAVLASIRNAKPASVKSNYVLNVTISTTMGPGIKVDPSLRS